MTETDIIYSVRQSISPVAALLQLSEEAAELAQAACKYARILDGTNPTPLTEQQAREALYEEFDDVQNAAKVAGIRGSNLRQWCKMIRWRERIEEEKRYAQD